MEKSATLEYDKDYLNSETYRINEVRRTDSRSSLEYIELRRKSFQYLNINLQIEDDIDEVVKNQEILYKLKNIHSEIGEVISEIHETFPQKQQIKNILSEIIEEDSEDQSTNESLHDCQVLPIKTSFHIFTMTNNDDTDEDENDTTENTKPSSKSKNLNLGKSKSMTQPSFTNTNINALSSCSSAKNMLVRCMNELNNVKKFLEQEQLRNRDAKQSSLHSKSTEMDGNHECVITGDEDTINVTVDETSPDGKLIISIAGPDGEKENIQIVMKKCPECERYDNNSSGEKAKYEDTFYDAKANTQYYNQSKQKTIEELDETTPSLYHSVSVEHKHIKPSSAKDITTHRSQQKFQAESRKKPKSDTSIKSTPAPQKKTPKETIKVAFDPDNPKNSKVIGPQQKDMPITLNETINMTFTSNTGEEFIFSLRVAQKNDDIDEESFQRNIKHNSTMAGTPIYRVEMFPNMLPRLRVCPSRELNIATLPTKLRDNGIKHKNADVEAILKEFGVDNLLRASRPVICGRVAILNAKSSDHIPYSVSLESLPLDLKDTDIIKQSLGLVQEKNNIRVNYKDGNKASRKSSVFLF